MRNTNAAIMILFLFTLSASFPAGAAQKVGAVVGLRGTALIQREGDARTAKLKDSIELDDIIETRKRSRAKMLFIDESILTLSSNSRASIKKFVYSKEGGGASIFNLLDGAMRSVVGKNKFEVHTPTSVAAARGTIIEFLVGTLGGKAFTRITCLRGRVDVWSADPTVFGIVPLDAGQTITVFESAPLPKPKSSPARKDPGRMATKKEKNAKGAGDKGDMDETFEEDDAGSAIDEVIEDTDLDEAVTPESDILPPVEQESEVETSPVKIEVRFP
jgi:hypothetical protein